MLETVPQKRWTLWEVIIGDERGIMAFPSIISEAEAPPVNPVGKSPFDSMKDTNSDRRRRRSQAVNKFL